MLMKIKFPAILIPAVILFSAFLLISCEPVSVSVNSKGDIAFTREEGVFFVNTASKKLTMLEYTYGQKEKVYPVIVRWSPKEDMLVYTAKKELNGADTEMYLINLKGEKKKIYTSASVITQIEWSPDASQISFAKAGDDTNLNVADIGIIKIADLMSKVLITNTGDMHRWIDGNTIVFIKINEKNADNSDILKGDLSFIKTDTGAPEILSKIMISKTGALDYAALSKSIAFTAIRAGEIGEFEKEMKSETFAFIYTIADKKINKISEDLVHFVKFSPDAGKLLIKNKIKDDYSGLVNLSVLDLKAKTSKVISNAICDSVYVNSATVQVYPAWLNNASVLYFRLINTYGSSGQALHLMSIDINSLKKQDNQILIDTEIMKIIESKGGY